MLRFKRTSYILSSFLFIFFLVGCENLAIDSNFEDIYEEDTLPTVLGTWVKEGNITKLSIVIHENYILFQQPWVGNDGRTATSGNFLLESIDGKNINLLDFDKNVITFEGILKDNTLIVSGLSRIKVFSAPYEPHDYQFWNGTYIKVE